MDIEACKIAAITGLSRPCINRIINAARKRIAEFSELDSPFDKGQIEIDERFFGARRVRGIRGRWAKAKHVVFGLIKIRNQVYTQVVTNCSAATLLPIIQERVNSDSEIFTDGFKAYDGLVDVGYKKHYRVYHNGNEFASGRKHINRIFNYRHENLYSMLLNIIRKKPLKIS